MYNNGINQGNNNMDNWYNGQTQNNSVYQQNVQGYQQNVQQAYNNQEMPNGLYNSQSSAVTTHKKSGGVGKVMLVILLMIISFVIGVFVGIQLNNFGIIKNNNSSEKEYDMSQSEVIKNMYIPTPGELAEVLKDLGFTQVYDGDDYVTSYDMDVNYKIYADKKSANINFDAYLDKSRALMENLHDKSKNHYSVLEVTETEINGCRVATIKKDYHNKNCEHWDSATKPEYIVETYILKENTLFYYAASSDSNWTKQTLAFTLESALESIGYIDLNDETKVE